MYINYYRIIIVLSICVALSSAQVTKASGLTQTEQWFSLANNNLPSAIASRDAIYRNDFIYLIGGRGSSGEPVATIYRAQVKRGVEFTENWISIGTLPRPLYSHTVVASDNYVYVIGGWDGTRVRGEVLRAQFLNDGGLSPWSEVAPFPFPIRIQVHNASILNGFIYVLGGADNTGKLLDTVYYAKIEANGALGQWQQTTHLPHVVYLHSVVAYNSHLYIIGGLNDETLFAQVYKAPTNPDGTLGDWTETTPLPTARYYAAAVVRKGQIIVMGGRNNSSTFSDVHAATIDTNGNLGPWSDLEQLPAPRNRFAAVVGSLGQIYVMGGLDSATNIGAGNYRSEVYVLAEPPSANCGMAAAPSGWLAPGQLATYTVTCKAGPQWPIKNLVATHPLPNGVTLKDGSGKGCTINSQPITCNFGQLAPSQIISGSYQVQRPEIVAPPTPTPSASGLQIIKSAPYTVNAGQPIAYTLVVTNSKDNSAKGTFVLTDQLPIGQVITQSITATTTGQLAKEETITHMVQPDPTAVTSQSYTVVWTIPVTLAQNDVITAQVALIPPAQKTTNISYSVSSTDGAYTATGSLPVVTYAGPEKDGLLVTSKLTWKFDGQAAAQSGDFALNWPFMFYLPYLSKTSAN